MIVTFSKPIYTVPTRISIVYNATALSTNEHAALRTMVLIFQDLKVFTINLNLRNRVILIGTRVVKHTFTVVVLK
jgi:hypothetical protein